jgi:hypothetical protein
MSDNSQKSRFAIQALLFVVVAAVCVFLYMFLVKHHDNKINSLTISEGADSATITRWEVIPQGNKNAAYTVFKDSTTWKIKLHDSRIVDADIKIVSRSLRHFSKFNNMTHVKLDKAKWKAEKLDEDSGTRVTVYTGDKIAGSYIVSKLGFIDQYKSSYYIRPVKSDSIYQISETYLDGSVLAKEENFRKRILVQVDPSFYQQIRIVSADTNVYYLLENTHGKWSISGRDIDQIKVLTYLKMLSLIQVPAFVTEYVKTPPEASVLIDTKSGPIKLIASKAQNGKWVMASSANIGNRLELTRPQVNAIFPPFSYFKP